MLIQLAVYYQSLEDPWLDIHADKSVLRRVGNSYMLVLRLCFVIVASQHLVDTRQMLYKYMIYENCVATSLWIIL